jgi:hypothetical protein
LFGDLLQSLAIWIGGSILVEDIKFSAWGGTILINRAAPTFFFGMAQCYTWCAALLSALHASQMICELGSQFGGNNANAITLDFPMVETHAEMLATLTTVKAWIRSHADILIVLSPIKTRE